MLIIVMTALLFVMCPGSVSAETAEDAPALLTEQTAPAAADEDSQEDNDSGTDETVSSEDILAEELPGEEEPGDTVPEDGWYEDESGRYYIENGEYVKNDPHKEIEGEWYQFDAEGHASKANIYTAGDTPFGNADRIWFYNVSGGLYGSDMILLESNGRYGLVDAGNRYEDTITDADGTVYPAPYLEQLSAQADGKNGRDGMVYLIKTLGVEHLDFIIGTHAHSDHIGGIPEIAALQVYGKDGLFHYLIDNNTVFFYKSYHHINDREDDLAAQQEGSWHNQAFLNAALQAVDSRGGTAVDLSCGMAVREGEHISADFSANLQAIRGTNAFEKVIYEARSATNPYDDRLICQWGGFTLDIYNLFAAKDASGENVNSMVTVITAGNHKVYLGGDIDTQNKTEQKLASVIAKDHGTMDVAKASHHGNNYSNSKEFADLLQPGVVITTGYRTNPNGESPSDSYQSFKYYAGRRFGTQFYEAGASGKMLAVLLENTVSMQAVTGEGAQAHFVTANRSRETAKPVDGWSHWNQSWSNSAETKWYYFENGAAATGWKSIDGYWYHFDEEGFMQANCWMKDSVGWCYLGSNGAMVRSTWKKDSTGWCWINGSGYWETASKWIRSGGEWYFIGANGYMAANCWAKDSVGWCYLGADGRLLRDCWKKDSVGWCWLGANGYIVSNRWIWDNGEWYYLKSNGYMAAGEWAKDSYGWMWMAGSGKITKGQWIWSGGSWYYLKADGYMATGTQVISGKAYRFAASGKWIN